MLKLVKPSRIPNLFVTDVGGQFHIQIATIMKLKLPPNYDHVAYPPRRRLRVLEKAKMVDESVGFIKMPKMIYWMRGPEPVHNRLVYGDYGVQAVTGGRLTFRQTESMRITILRNIKEKYMFAEWRIPSPWQSVTKKGTGQRMGSGKAKVDTNVIPIRPGRIILEVGGECEVQEVKDFLTTITKYLPFESRVISRKMMEEEEEREKELEKLNLNPVCFEYGAKTNLMGIKKHLSPYDYKWHGKYR